MNESKTTIFKPGSLFGRVTMLPLPQWMRTGSEASKA